MRNCKDMNYETQIKRRIRILYLLLTAMLAYMVAIAEMGGGDSRRIWRTDSAVSSSSGA